MALPRPDREGPHPVDVLVGRRLCLRRKLLGLTQRDLAAATGLTFQQVQKYETAANRISASRLHDFARILGVPVCYFFAREPASFAAGPEPDLCHCRLTGEYDAVSGSELVPEVDPERETLELVRSYHAIGDDGLRKTLLALLHCLPRAGLRDPSDSPD